MKNPVYANETAQEYAERMRLVLAVMALPKGEEGGILLNAVEYDRHKDALAPYNPRRVRCEGCTAFAAALTGSDHYWMVTADMTEGEYQGRVYRPWRAQVKANER